MALPAFLTVVSSGFIKKIQILELFMMVKVAFLHPDLGIGGAERAVLDAGLALKSKGHSVEFFTAHHDPKHCFQETKDGTFQVKSLISSDPGKHHASD